MTRRNVVFALVFGALSAVAVLAADVSGTWTGTATGGDGNSFSLVYNFKQDGTKLTGTVTGPQGDPITIEDGKVEGNKLSFTVKIHGDQEMVIHHDGTLDGEEITLNSKFERADFEVPPMKLKKSKA